MSKVIKQAYGSERTVMLTPRWEALTVTVPGSKGVDVGNGRKMVPGGTPLPANDATCLGVLPYDVDVTYGDTGAALAVRGNVNAALLAERGIVISDAAKAATPTLKFITPDVEA